ncbi:CoA pyrophosphatase [Vineibacter terrae]|uniref:CoA pyrophosphatase n=1 Tax=Vineibacter terrae TaxID=2586908 RepID=UPI002E302C52|nr:CoA pyrophosphatase [Vineibacter terrae]HEX2891206.1 CoA pyrophosphatase [Vineibacter terrae]
MTMTRDEVRTKLQARNEAIAAGRLVPPAYVGSDFALNGADRPPADLRPAAVLVPLVDRASGLTVLLTQRTADMPSHAGQIAFPGGGRRVGDPDLIATALRETEEEIGVGRNLVDIVGLMDNYVTGSGFLITPVVGFVQPRFELKPDPREVADVFEVPLDFFLDPANHHIHSRTWQGRERRYYAMPYGERYVWGATAGMIKNLWRILSGLPE